MGKNNMDRKSKSQITMSICVAVCIVITGICSLVLLFKAQMKMDGGDNDMEYESVFTTDVEIGNCG